MQDIQKLFQKQMAKRLIIKGHVNGTAEKSNEKAPSNLEVSSFPFDLLLQMACYIAVGVGSVPPMRRRPGRTFYIASIGLADGVQLRADGMWNGCRPRIGIGKGRGIRVKEPGTTHHTTRPR